VELEQAHAERRHGVVSVALDVRATLRTRRGHTYLAQTQAHCHQRGSVAATAAAPLFYGCMMSIGRELAGWLGGVNP